MIAGRVSRLTRSGIRGVDGRIRDLSAHIEDLTGPWLSPESLSRLSGIDIEQPPIVAREPRIGPCVGSVGKFICVGLNYTDHATEAGLPVPSEPIIFLKATSSIAGPYDGIGLPFGSEKTDWEVELGVVIGQRAKNVAASEALDYVAGYCVVNDVSERAYQLERGGQWTKGKSFDSFGPIGPWLVTRDEVPNPQDLGMWLEVDGKRYQDASTRTMIFGVTQLVSYLSQFMTLHPGDVIATGTPAGVGLGQKPPVYLVPGNVVRLSIERLGEQRQVCRTMARA